MSTSSETEAVVVLTTIGTADDAEALARAFVEENLAACVGILPEMRSIYRWQGKTVADHERQLMIKTTAGRVEALRRRLHELHPYELPEFLVLPVAEGSTEYLRWIADNTARGR
jgi:periplasmic divalent cation tolerance protein